MHSQNKFDLNSIIYFASVKKDYISTASSPLPYPFAPDKKVWKLSEMLQYI